MWPFRESETIAISKTFSPSKNSFSPPLGRYHPHRMHTLIIYTRAIWRQEWFHAPLHTQSLSPLPRSSPHKFFSVDNDSLTEACRIPSHPLPPSPSLSWMLWSFRTGPCVDSPAIPREGFPLKRRQGCPLMLGFWAVEKISIFFSEAKWENPSTISCIFLLLIAFFQPHWLRES